MDSIARPMDINEFQEHFNIKSNFLEYGSVCIIIKNFLDYKDAPNCQSIHPEIATSILLSTETLKGYPFYIAIFKVEGGI